MAEKRMIAQSIIDSDIFLDMPVSTQNLYFHLNIRADDEGFIDSPKKIMRIVNASNNDLDMLLAKRYVLSFKSGVIVIKHWKIHNVLRKERIKPTLYQEEKDQLSTKENGAYTDRKIELSDRCPTDGSEMSEEIRLDKVSIEEIRLDYKTPVENRNYSKQWDNLRVHWNNLGFPEYRKLIVQENNAGEIKNWMEPYTYEEIEKSIDNYNDLKDKEEFKYQTFKSFMSKGIDRFFDGAKPHDRYKTRSAEDEAQSAKFAREMFNK